MSILDYCRPSFEMKVKTYDANELIEFEGKNNWYVVVLTNVCLGLFVAFWLYGYSHFLPEWFMFRFVVFIVVMMAFGFVSNNVKKAKSPKYMKEEVSFSKEGIVVNYSKLPKNRELIKTKNIKLIDDGELFKFILYSRDKPHFEFSVSPDSRFGRESFKRDVMNILGLQLDDDAAFGRRKILILKKKEEFQVNAIADKEAVGPVYSKEVSKKKRIGSRHFFILREERDLFIKDLTAATYFGIPETIHLSNESGFIEHKRMFSVTKKFKFTDVLGFEINVESKSSRETEGYIEGVLLLVVARMGPQRVFTIVDDIDVQQELVEVRVLKSLELLVETIKKEIGFEDVGRR